MKNADDERAMMLAAALGGVVVDCVIDETFDGPYHKHKSWRVGITHEQHQRMLSDGYGESTAGTIPFPGHKYICICCTLAQRGR